MLDRVMPQSPYPYPPPAAGYPDDPPLLCRHPGCTHLAGDITCRHPECTHASEVTPRKMLTQRLLGGALMLVLIGFTLLLWGADGAFRILFTAYTVWAGYWLWALFVKRPSIWYGAGGRCDVPIEAM